MNNLCIFGRCQWNKPGVKSDLFIYFSFFSGLSPATQCKQSRLCDGYWQMPWGMVSGGDITCNQFFFFNCHLNNTWLFYWQWLLAPLGKHERKYCDDEMAFVCVGFVWHIYWQNKTSNITYRSNEGSCTWNVAVLEIWDFRRNYKDPASIAKTLYFQNHYEGASTHDRLKQWTWQPWRFKVVADTEDKLQKVF